MGGILSSSICASFFFFFFFFFFLFFLGDSCNVFSASAFLSWIPVCVKPGSIFVSASGELFSPVLLPWSPRICRFAPCELEERSVALADNTVPLSCFFTAANWLTSSFVLI